MKKLFTAAFYAGLFARARHGISPGPLIAIALSSIAWAFCYPPFPLGPLVFVVLVPLFAATKRLSPTQAFWHNFLGGWGYNIVMYWWIYNVIKVGPPVVIGVGLVLAVLFLSLFNGLLGWMFRMLSDNPWGLAAYPLLWGGLEVLRSRGEMSFPWNNIGYALGHWNSLIQSVSFLGIFGLSIAIVLCNCLLFFALEKFGPLRWVSVVAACGIPLWLAFHGQTALAAPEPAGETMDIALVQPAIPQTKKWDEHYFHEVMEKTWRTMEADSLSISPALAGSELIVLPETAVPDFLRNDSAVYAGFFRVARKYHADVLIGSLDYSSDDNPIAPYRFFNSAFLFPGDGEDSVAQYSKLKLVPFSERLPFDDVFPLLNYVNLGEGDFSPGQGYALWGRRVRYSPSICYEVIYSDFVREARRGGASVLLNITNDGWFGNSNEPYQHAAIARFRAIESGMPIARCSNTGISVFYDYKGRVIGKTKLFEQTVLRRKLPLTMRDTWYLAHGDTVESWLAWLFPIGLLWCAWAGQGYRQVKQNP